MDELVFIAFWQRIFKLPLKTFQNIVILCFQFVKFPCAKYILKAEMKVVEFSFFITNVCLCTCINGIKKPDISWQKFLISFNSVTRSTFCSFRLNIIIKQWKYRIANILNWEGIFFQGRFSCYTLRMLIHFVFHHSDWHYSKSIWKMKFKVAFYIPAKIYLFKVNDSNTRKSCEISSIISY